MKQCYFQEPSELLLRAGSSAAQSLMNDVQCATGTPSLPPEYRVSSGKRTLKARNEKVGMPLKLTCLSHQRCGVLCREGMSAAGCLINWFPEWPAHADSSVLRTRRSDWPACFCRISAMLSSPFDSPLWVFNEILPAKKKRRTWKCVCHLKSEALSDLAFSV